MKNPIRRLRQGKVHKALHTFAHWGHHIGHSAYLVLVSVESHHMYGYAAAFLVLVGVVS